MPTLAGYPDHMFLADPIPMLAHMNPTIAPTLAEYLHTLSPFLLRFTENFGIRWYGLSYVIGFIIAYFIMRWMASRGLTQIPRERVADAMFTVVLGTLLGGRIGYVLVYEPSLFTQFSESFPYWGLLAINRGGMASHGAMVGLVLAAWWVSRGFKAEPRDGSGPIRFGQTTTLHVMDVLALVSPIGVLLGRIANFINGELLGRIVAKGGEPAPWWSVRYPQELSGWIGPDKRDAASHTPDLTIAQASDLWVTVNGLKQPSEPWSVGIKNLLERAGEHRDLLTKVVTARHPSQIYQGIAEGIVVGIIIWLFWAKPRKPGFIAGIWFIAYGIGRVATEFVRLPDAQFIGDDNARPFGLSRGQWLSVAMVVVGAALNAIARRSAVAALGGWNSPPAPISPAPAPKPT